MTNRTLPETPVGGPLGDTGDGDTGVPEFEQGISNRPGDRAESAGTAVNSVDGDNEADLEDEDLDLDDDELRSADDDAADEERGRS